MADAIKRAIFPVNPDRASFYDDDITKPEDRTLNRALMDFKRNMWGYDQGLWDIRDLGDIISFQAAGYGGGSLNYANVSFTVHQKKPLRLGQSPEQN